MQLKTTQVVGLIAVVVFGGIFAATLLPSTHDPLRTPAAPVRAPSPEPLASAASTAAPSPTGIAPTMPADPLAAGSAEAKDDLYCQGLIYAAHRAEADPANPADRRRILMVPALASSGADRLIREGVATRETTAIFADAHTDVAMQDFARGKPRILLAACEARADAALKALGQ